MKNNSNYTTEQILALEGFVKLIRAANSVSDRAGKTWRGAGLTASQFGVLEALYHLGPICQKEIAKKILKTTGNITMVIENLYKGGLVYRERDKADKRFIRIHLTDKGKKMIQQIFPSHVETIVNEFSIFSPEEQKLFGQMCKKLGIGITS